MQIPGKPLQPRFDGDNSSDNIDAFHTLFTDTGIHFLNEGIDINRTTYPVGYCLFAFDLTPDLSAHNTSHWSLIRSGTLRIDVRFAQALTETINCVVYAEFDHVLEIDSNRQIITDYSA